MMTDVSMYTNNLDMLIFMTNRPLHCSLNKNGHKSKMYVLDGYRDTVIKVHYKKQSFDQTEVNKCRNKTYRCLGILVNLGLRVLKEVRSIFIVSAG